jgi:hypothetical protein
MNGDSQTVTEIVFDAVTGFNEPREPQAGQSSPQFIRGEVRKQDLHCLVDVLAEETFVEVVAVQVRDIEIVGRPYRSHRLHIELVVSRVWKP